MRRGERTGEGRCARTGVLRGEKYRKGDKRCIKRRVRREESKGGNR